MGEHIKQLKRGKLKEVEEDKTIKVNLSKFEKVITMCLLLQHYVHS